MLPRRRFLAGLGAVTVGGVAACSDDEPDASGASPTTADGSSSDNGPTRDGEPTVAATIAEGLNVPWSIVFLAGGDALVSERDAARILRITPAGDVTPLGEVPDVAPSDDFGEGGLLGLALAPDDASTLFACHTTDIDNRVVRMSITGDRLGTPSPVLTGIPASTHHNGGGLAFGPDGLLYVSTGDAEESSRAQDTDDLGGKVLRIRPDGGAAPGNPYGNEVWTYGHRNVEGITFDAAGRLWAAEFGDAAFDELNLIERGDNYGWPEVEGMDGGEFTDPLQTWAPAECSPSGIAIARSTAYLGALRGERLIAVPLDGASAGTPTAWFTGEYGRIRSVAAAPDGSLWVGTSNTDGRADPTAVDDRILRVTL
ncbi:MAG: PQQ-dependent sugar dehydrogenase [Nocardioidaceae bacterium]